MAALVNDDRIYETSTTTGTGSYALAGAVTGFQPFSVIGAGNYCWYFATDDVNWEAGIGTYSASPDTLARTQVIYSSNGDAAVDWAAGTRKIRCGLTAWAAAPQILSKSVAGSSNVTLTAHEQRRKVLVFTGALTGNIDVIVDTTVWDWIVYNNTSGAYTLTMKVSGQTGVKLLQGERRHVYCDGTDVRLSEQPNAAFAAYRSAGAGAQTMSDASFTKVQFDTEEFDLGGYYDNATNYRWTPPAGKYLIGGYVSGISAVADQNQFLLSLFKNGSRYKDFNSDFASGAGGDPASAGAALVEADGDDYFELYYFQNTGGDKTITGSQITCYFWGRKAE